MGVRCPHSYAAEEYDGETARKGPKGPKRYHLDATNVWEHLEACGLIPLARDLELVRVDVYGIGYAPEERVRLDEEITPRREYDQRVFQRVPRHIDLPKDAGRSG